MKNVEINIVDEDAIRTVAVKDIPIGTLFTGTIAGVSRVFLSAWHVDGNTVVSLDDPRLTWLGAAKVSNYQELEGELNVRPKKGATT